MQEIYQWCICYRERYIYEFSDGRIKNIRIVKVSLMFRLGCYCVRLQQEKTNILMHMSPTLMKYTPFTSNYHKLQ